VRGDDLAGNDEAQATDLPLRGLEEPQEVERFGPSRVGVLYGYPEPALLREVIIMTAPS
jgi:hypothetical protein